MEISDEFTGDICVVSTRGRLDGNSSEQFGGRLQALIAPDRSKLLVDFSGINFVTSAGLRAVILVLKKVKAANGVFALCAVQAPVREVLEITGFTSMLQIYPDRAGAISALS
jgi:anti-anti-sigma factor